MAHERRRRELPRPSRWVALLTAVAFLATSAPVRLAWAGPEEIEPAETPNFSEMTNGVRAGGDEAGTSAKKAKQRIAPVSASGTFTHAIALQVPPGRLGMTPALSLSYDSGSVAESAVGVGWSFGPPSISRSTRLGFPKVKGPDLLPSYDEAGAIFTGPAGELVAATNGPATTQVFAPVRERSPVRFERNVAADGWIEHDASGAKRHYGFDPIRGRPARITNELGTHAWLLTSEVDPHGNWVAYQYHHAGEANRPQKRAAQRRPILSRVEWGGNGTTQPPPFFVQVAIAPQPGPVSLLDGNTVLGDRITRIDVGIDAAIAWSYVLEHRTSETGKLLLASVARTGDAPEKTTFGYSKGAPESGPRWKDMGPIASSAGDPIYTNHSRWFDSVGWWFRPDRATPVQAFQAPAYRSGVKFIDVDGNGTTDAVYHASGLGTTDTHVLWEESSLQAAATSGLGAWSVPAAGAGGSPSTQPQTGLPYFPPNGPWSRSDFGDAALRELADLDGDGDADAVALPTAVEVLSGHGVLYAAPPPHFPPAAPPGQGLIRVFTNTARQGPVQHVQDELVSNWPRNVGFDVGGRFGPAARILARSGTDPGSGARAPLVFKVEPLSDLQTPLLDLNADGKTDLVLVKRRHQHANYLPPGAPSGGGPASPHTGAYAVPIGALQRVYARMARQEPAERVTGVRLDDHVRRDVQSGAIVLVDDGLLRTRERPSLYARLVTSAERLLVPELPPNTRMILYAAPGGIPMPGDRLPIVPPRTPELDFVPGLVEETPWWMPQVDPEGDVYLPLRDAYDLGRTVFDFQLFYGAYRYVPRVFLMQGDAQRSFQAEPQVNRSRFEGSLRDHLNPGWTDECTSLTCRYPPHVNFTTSFVDVNADDLPDLVTAVKPTRWRDSSGARVLTCEDGHDLFLNRGYAFERVEGETLQGQAWTSSTNPKNPFNEVANRDRYCDVTRPRIDDRSKRVGQPPPIFPTGAMAQADIDGDGRIDVVLAHQRVNGSPTVEQRVYLNRARGWIAGSAASPPVALPPGVAVSRWQFPPGANLPASLAGWPRVGQADRARLVDLDGDGLTDLALAGDCVRTQALAPPTCVPATWYRNLGALPDRLEQISSTTGGWMRVEYVAPKTADVEVPPEGLHPPATARLVKTIRSAAGPVPTPAGHEPFPVEEMHLSYANWVKDLLSMEGVGFEKVVARFVNSFEGVPRETVQVTRTYDVRPTVNDPGGAPLPIRHPLRGAVVSTVTESAGWTATDLVEHLVEALGDGVRIRERRTLRGEASGTGSGEWSAEETVSFDPFGHPTERVAGNWDGTAISPAEDRRTTKLEYENRVGPWQLGLVTRERRIGWSEDVAGGVDPTRVLSETVTAFDAKGSPEKSTRVMIRGGPCAGPDDATTTWAYWPNGLPKEIRHPAVRDPATGAIHERVVAIDYDPKRLNPAEIRMRVGKLSGAAFTPATAILREQLSWDLRTGQPTKEVPPSGAATLTTWDSRGRLVARGLATAPATTLVAHAYQDTFPLRVTRTVTTDAGKSYVERVELDSDGNTLSIVRGLAGGSQWARTAKTRYDAFGRAVESFLPEWVASIDAGSAPSSGPRHVTTYDGFDRPTKVVRADGATTTTVYAPRETVETNPRSVVTRRRFDAFGGLVTVERNPGGAAGESATQRFVRDGRGEVVRIQDADGGVRRFERDGGGRLLHLTLPAQPTAQTAAFTLCHDMDDRLVHLDSPAGRVIDVLHDEIGRPLVTRATSGNSAAVEVRHTYDEGPPATHGLGRRTSTVDSSGTQRFTYSALGLPATVEFTPSARARAGATNLAATYSAAFSYSRTGLLLSVELAGLPKLARVTYGRDFFGKAHTVTTAAGAAATDVASGMFYDASDRLLFARYGNGTVGKWAYNPLSERLDRLAVDDVAGAMLAAVDYQYDANGNVASEVRARQGQAGSQKTHEFDALDRLRSSRLVTQSGAVSEASTYSPGGNLLTAGGDAYTYASQACSQAVTRIHHAAADRTRTLSYDADGYVGTDEETHADGSTSKRTLTFDALGCLESVVRNDAAPAGTATSAASEQTCGADGQVVARATTRADGSRARRVDFAGLAELRPDDGVLLLRVPLGGSVFVEDARSLATGDRDVAASQYLVNDLRGSVLASTAFASTAVEREAEFDAWGRRISGWSTLPAPRHGFTGVEADEAVGTYSFGARTYDPSLRRWTAPDPLLAALPHLDEATGEELNLYAYARNNPATWTDPGGQWVMAVVAAAAVVIGMGLEAPSDSKAAPPNVLGMMTVVPGVGPALGAGATAAIKVVLPAVEKSAPAVANVLKAVVSAERAGSAPALAASAEKHAADIHAKLSPIAQKHTVTAVSVTNKGELVVGRGVRDLSKIEVATIQSGGAHAAVMAGEHAEPTVLSKVWDLGQKPVGMGIAGGPNQFCPGICAPGLQQGGAQLIGPRQAIWPQNVATPKPTPLPVTSREEKKK
jgi:RHS repeat-associated protein